MRQRIERLAFDLLDESAMGNVDIMLRILCRLDKLVRFGVLIFEIEPLNGKLILDGIERLRKHVGTSEVEFGNQFFDIPQGENQLPLSAASSKQESAIFKRESAPAKRGEKHERHNVVDEEKEEIDDNSAIRQSAILDKIRQSGNGKVFSKDIFAAFPDISQRTLRYDLQKLCRQGSIVRLGEGGPNTAYQLRSL